MVETRASNGVERGVVVDEARSVSFEIVFRRACLAGVLVLTTLAGALQAQVLVSIPAPDGGTIHGDLYGTGARGVVLAHGGRFDRSSWRKQAQALADAGFRALAIDFRAAVESRAG